MNSKYHILIQNYLIIFQSLKILVYVNEELSVISYITYHFTHKVLTCCLLLNTYECVAYYCVHSTGLLSVLPYTKQIIHLICCRLWKKYICVKCVAYYSAHITGLFNMLPFTKQISQLICCRLWKKYIFCNCVAY